MFSSLFFLLEISGLSQPQPPFFKEEAKKRSISWPALEETAHSMQSRPSDQFSRNADSLAKLFHFPKS